MITKKISNLPKSLIEIEITVPWADFSNRFEEVLQRLQSETELPGFRKGQAPQEMVEQSLGNKLSEEVFRIVFPEKLVEALQGTEIVPIDYPRYQLISFVKGQAVTYKASVTKRPEVKIGDYKNIKAQRPAQKVITEEDINKLVDDLFKRWKSRQPTASEVIPDDNFAKAVGALSLADLRTKLKADLESEAKYNNELDYEEAILQEVEKVTTVEIPDVLIEDELNRMLVSLQRRVADMGLLMEDYLKGQGETLESIKNKWRPQAEKNVRMELGLAEVGRLEKVEISDLEIQAEIDKIQDVKLKTQFEQQEPRLHLRHSLRQIKTLDLLKKVTGAA